MHYVNKHLLKWPRYFSLIALALTILLIIAIGVRMGLYRKLSEKQIKVYDLILLSAMILIEFIWVIHWFWLYFVLRLGNWIFLVR